MVGFHNYLVTTGAVSGCAFTTSYPFHVFSNVYTANRVMAGIAFSNATISDPVATASRPGVCMTYARTDATTDMGNLNFCMTSDATNRALVLQLRNTGNVNLGTNANMLSRMNINTGTLESKICLFDAGSSTMSGFGCSANMFNFQMPSASYGYYFRYGGTNDTGTLMVQFRTATVNTVANTACLGIGLAGAPSFQLHLNVDSAYKPTTSTWSNTSDRRIKENIEEADLDLCLKNMKTLRLMRFRYKNEILADGVINDRNVLGWIAQDVENVFPRSVTTVNMYGISDLKNLNVDEINRTHYGATQKLIQKVETLESMVETLMNKINDLENEIKILKN